MFPSSLKCPPIGNSNPILNSVSHFRQYFNISSIAPYRTLLMSLRFWKGRELFRVTVCRNGPPSSDLVGELGSLARLFSVVSTKADIVACSGCPAELLRTMDEMQTTTRAVQSCFRFSQLDMPHLIHKLSYSVFGHIDFFSVLKGLVISLGSSLREDWVQRSPELVRVSIFQSFDEI